MPWRPARWRLSLWQAPAGIGHPSQWEWCNSADNLCIVGHGVNQGLTYAGEGSASNFHSENGVSYGGHEYVEYNQVGTSRCLELHTSNVVVMATYSTSVVAQQWRYLGNLNNGSSGHGVLENLYAVENPNLYPAGVCMDMYAPNNHPDGAVVGACSTTPVNYRQWWGF